MVYIVYIIGSNINGKIELGRSEFMSKLMPLLNLFPECQFEITTEKVED